MPSQQPGDDAERAPASRGEDEHTTTQLRRGWKKAEVALFAATTTAAVLPSTPCLHRRVLGQGSHRNHSDARPDLAYLSLTRTHHGRAAEATRPKDRSGGETSGPLSLPSDHWGQVNPADRTATRAPCKKG